MMRFLRWLVVILVTVLLVSFAVSNRDSVSLTFWPLPAVLETSLYLVVLLALAVGFLAGIFVAWINAGSRRRELRQRQRRIEALERELAATQTQLPTMKVPARIA